MNKEIPPDLLNRELTNLARIRSEWSLNVPDEAILAASERLKEMRDVAALLDILHTPHFVSHRPVLGPVIVFAKKWLVKGANKILQMCLPRQIEFNQKSWNVLFRVYELEERVNKLEERLEKSLDGSSK